MAPRIAIYGSCVARDTFEHLFPEEKPSMYVARQSLISANGPALSAGWEQSLSSTFQKRMLDWDSESQLFPLLRSRLPESDILVIDLVDERLGVLELPTGPFVTLSPEFRRTEEFAEIRPEATVIPFGEDRHFELWREGAISLKNLLLDAGFLNRTLVLETSFASREEDGTPVPDFKGVAAGVWDQKYARYFDELDALGYPSFHLPPGLSLSTKDHKFGPDPYHYIDDAYSALGQAVSSLLQQP